MEVVEEKVSEETKDTQEKPEVEVEEKPTETDEKKPEEETIFTFGDEEQEKEEDSTVIRTLRKRDRENRKLIKRQSELLKTYEEKPSKVGEKPTLENCDMDTDRFERELLSWKVKKDDFDSEQKANEEQQLKVQKQWDEKVVTYTGKRKEFKRPDFEEKEQVVIDALGDRKSAAIIDVCENSIEMMYALGSNPEKLKQLAETNDASYMFALGRLSKEMKTITRKPTTTPEKTITGDAPVSGGNDKELERLRDEANKTGDLTKLIAYKRKMKSKN